MIKAKNNKQASDTWCGMLIQPTEYYEIEEVELIKWQNNSKVLSDISSGDLILNNGTDDISDIAKAINFLKGIDTSPVDEDGARILRPKAAKAGWKAQFHSIRISTATENGVYSKDRNGNDTGFCTYTMYTGGGQVTTDPTQCVKTVVTWEPTHDMEIIGGKLIQRNSATSDVWLFVTVAAHIPAQYGGSIEFTKGGINLYDAPSGGEVDFDGRASKYVSYDSQYHSGRFEIMLKHDLNVQHTFTLIFELFKP